ncbi:MAG: WD40 repeat domain-containing protein [Treponema sp.]|nr:WD40 repeat domain-containing protein [Treponema sp.]
MAQQKKRIRVLIIFLLFIAYFIIAARPIPRETILAPGWLSSLESDAPVSVGGAGQMQERLFPFTLGVRFGYVNAAGFFSINNIKTGGIYLGENLWTEYSAEPEIIEIKNIDDQTVMNIENPRGYPVLLDNRVFTLGSEQNALSEIDKDGNILWTYEFGAPLTCIDAAGGLVLTGSIDGVVEILDAEGKRIFYFEPGGSRYSVILGCAISRNGSQIGIISGIDQQRFLLLEHFGGNGDYKVVYHEFLSEGFRRPVIISFTDEDRRIVFERAQGLGCYNIKSRQGFSIPLDGEITAIDNSGDKGFFFLINSRAGRRKELVGIRFPQDNRLAISGFKRDTGGAVFIRAPFYSDNVFLGRNGRMIIAGGGTKLISFIVEEK